MTANQSEGVYIVTTTKTSLPFRRALNAISRSGFNTIFTTRPPSSNLLTAHPRQIMSFPWDLLSKINQSEMKKWGVFVAGVPSS